MLVNGYPGLNIWTTKTASLIGDLVIPVICIIDAIWNNKSHSGLDLMSPLLSTSRQVGYIYYWAGHDFGDRLNPAFPLHQRTTYMMIGLICFAVLQLSLLHGIQQYFILYTVLEFEFGVSGQIWSYRFLSLMNNYFVWHNWFFHKKNIVFYYRMNYWSLKQELIWVPFLFSYTYLNQRCVKLRTCTSVLILVYGCITALQQIPCFMS